MLELIGWLIAGALVLAIPDPGEPHYLLFGILLAIAFRMPLPWSSAAVAVTSVVYLWQGTLGLQELPAPALYDTFLAEITFVVVLNAATYVGALLHAETLANAERREALLREREELLQALGQAEQRERRRIAEILHDNLQQLLIAAKMAHTSGDVHGKLGPLIDEAVQAARDLTVELHPPVLDEQGLGAAFRWLGARYKDVCEVGSPSCQTGSRVGTQ